MGRLNEHPAIKKAIALVLSYVIVQMLISTNIISDYLQVTLATICINIILAVSLNLITGITGQFSLGHAGFMSIGAYMCALIVLRMPTIPGFCWAFCRCGSGSAGWMRGRPSYAKAAR